MTPINPMFTSFKLSDEEFALLMNKFDKLATFASWQLKRKNNQNNLTDDVDDIAQELRIAIYRAGVYYKRQVYIEECLRLADEYARDRFVRGLLAELRYLWTNRTKHGAHKQKFGTYQEKMLDMIVAMCVPPKCRPNPQNILKIDKKFTTYCKQITWNQQKSLGRKITRERSIRSGLVSLSEHDYVSNMMVEQ